MCARNFNFAPKFRQNRFSLTFYIFGQKFCDNAFSIYVKNASYVFCHFLRFLTFFMCPNVFLKTCIELLIKNFDKTFGTTETN